MASVSEERHPLASRSHNELGPRKVACLRMYAAGFTALLMNATFDTLRRRRHAQRDRNVDHVDAGGRLFEPPRRRGARLADRCLQSGAPAGPTAKCEAVVVAFVRVSQKPAGEVRPLESDLRSWRKSSRRRHTRNIVLAPPGWEHRRKGA
jgi:hypothetical protein